MPTVEQTGRELLAQVRDGRVPLLTEIVVLEEPWRFRILKALPSSCRTWKVKPNPHLAQIKARFQDRMKNAKKDPERVLPNVAIEDGEVVSVSFRFGKAEYVLKTGEIHHMPTETAVFAMTQQDIATGEQIMLLVDEGYEGPEVKPAAGSPGEKAPPEKTVSLKELFEAAERADLVREYKDADEPGVYYGDAETGVFLGRTIEAAIKALGGKRKDVAEALRHQVG